jgi:hypothetical protein
MVLNASAHLSWGMGVGRELVDAPMMCHPNPFCALLNGASVKVHIKLMIAVC